MRQTVKSGRTLLLDGPASIKILSGKASVLGAKINAGDRILVRSGKRMPFFFSKESEVELFLGESATFTEVEGDTIPQSWKDAASSLVKDFQAKRTLLVMGGVDSGKTSLCTYLANIAFNEGCKVAIIDGDLGQSDIGPPTTLGFSLLEKYITDPFETRPYHMIFVGATSPGRAQERVIQALETLNRKAAGAGATFIVINTDGWIHGEAALEYKFQLVKAVSPETIIGIEENKELEPILSRIEESKIIKVKPPNTIKKRSREVRKALREMAYKRYLKNAKVRLYNLNWTKIIGSLTLSSLDFRRPLDLEKLKAIKDVLGFSPYYYCETQDRITIFIDKTKCLTEETLRRLKSTFKKQVVPMIRGTENGILVGLKDSKGDLLGIGVLCCVDPKRKVAKVYTPVNEAVTSIHLGEVRLTVNGKEIEYPVTLNFLEEQQRDINP